MPTSARCVRYYFFGYRKSAKNTRIGAVGFGFGGERAMPATKIEGGPRKIFPTSPMFSTTYCVSWKNPPQEFKISPKNRGLSAKNTLTFADKIVYNITLSGCRRVYTRIAAPLTDRKGEQQCSVHISPRSVIARWSTVSVREWLPPTVARFWLAEERRAALV